jgi:hypothetical protein
MYHSVLSLEALEGSPVHSTCRWEYSVFPKPWGLLFLVIVIYCVVSLRSSMVERLICNQMVGGSNPSGGSRRIKGLLIVAFGKPFFVDS